MPKAEQERSRILKQEKKSLKQRLAELSILGMTAFGLIFTVPAAAAIGNVGIATIGTSVATHEIAVVERDKERRKSDR